MFRIRDLLLVPALVVAAACGSFRPRPIDEVPFKERAVTRSDEVLTVTVAVLADDEAEQVFGRDVAGKGMQPVWLEVVNRSDVTYFVFPVGLDPEYFAPYESAYLNHITWGGATNDRIDEHFLRLALVARIDPGETNSGFVMTNLDRGAKALNVELVSPRDVRRFEFLVEVPNLRADYKQRDGDAIFTPEEIVDFVEEEKFREALAALPRACRDESGEDEGDPLNLVLVGTPRQVIGALVRVGWHMTETVHTASSWKTTTSFLFGSKYKYSPVSSLYVFGRSQDIAVQKARATIHERNHLRLWTAPLSWKGTPVFLGQISRDIGVRLTWRTIVTHKIDPWVDEARWQIVQEMIRSQAVARVGYVGGVGRAPYGEPRHNLTGDPYYTDGVRAVFFVAEEPRGIADVEILDWDRPGRQLIPPESKDEGTEIAPAPAR